MMVEFMISLTLMELTKVQSLDTSVKRNEDIWVANAGSASVSKIIGITKGPQYWPYSGPEFPGGGN